MWGNNAEDVPIVHFSNHGLPASGRYITGVGHANPARRSPGRLSIWDPNYVGWKDFHAIWLMNENGPGGWTRIIESTDVIRYDDWNDIEIRLRPDQRQIEYRLNGVAVLVWEPDDPDFDFPDTLSRMTVVARNEGAATYDANWADLSSGALFRAGTPIAGTADDLVIDPDGPVRTARVTADAMFGGSLTSKGGTEGVTAQFLGPVTVRGKTSRANTAFQFATAADLRGGLDLTERSSTTGRGRIGGAVNVDETSRLGGHWTIAGPLTVDGTLPPGDAETPISTMRVETTASDALTFGEDAIYEVDITADGRSDHTDVAGRAHLAGTVQVRTDGDDDVRIGHAYTIVDADGGFGGTRFAAAE